jgi:hypothetical protein
MKRPQAPAHYQFPRRVISEAEWQRRLARCARIVDRAIQRAIRAEEQAGLRYGSAPSAAPEPAAQLVEGAAGSARPGDELS